MRNTIKTLAALLIVFGSAKTYANVDSANVAVFCKVVAQDADDSYKLIYRGAEKKNLKVQWLDESSQVIYKENLKETDGFVKQYDLSGLPDGSYTVQITTEDGFSYVEDVKLGDMSDFRFLLKGSDEKDVILTGFQPDSKEVSVVILDEAGDLIFKESIKETKSVQKKYNFEQMDTESVTFLLYHNDKMFKEEVISFK